MPGSATDSASSDFVVIHPADPEDAAITSALRAMVPASVPTSCCPATSPTPSGAYVPEATGAAQCFG